MNKSAIVNTICVLFIIFGHTLAPSAIRDQVLGAGYFGFSGAITNWLAIHMLFEKVPFLYGSGIIPLKFEAFKTAIRNMIMSQFFTVDNIRKFMQGESGTAFNLTPVLESLDYDKIFDGFLEVVAKSKFGGMLAMFGGVKALEPMRANFKETLKIKLLELTLTDSFKQALANHSLEGLHAEWQEKIAAIVSARLEELTPQMVKEIIQEMIRSHLGWLVVWGGVFGGLIGLVTSFIK